MKLVRDRIPELAASTGQPTSVHRADPDEFARRLRDKLLTACCGKGSSS